MKRVLSFICLLVFSNVLFAGEGSFLVKKWIVTPNSSVKKKCEIRRYNEKKELLNIVHFDYQKNVVVDSVIFKYDEKSKMIEQVEYVYKAIKKEYSMINKILYLYDSLGKLIDIKGDYKESQLYYPQYFSVKFKNLLNLMEDEMAVVDKIISNTDSLFSSERKMYNGIVCTKDIYMSNFRPAVLNFYGVPNNEFLRKMTIYYSDDSLLHFSVFLFDKLRVKQNYIYRDGVVSEIKTEVIYNGGEKRCFREGFTFF